MSIVPLSLNRVSVPLQTNRAYTSLQTAQTLMARYEQQIMTERQYQYGSDSPYNATTTLGIQSQMERKAQNSANIQTTQTYLSATDSTLSRFSTLTDDARGIALDAINTTTGASERQTLAQTVKQIVQQSFDFGNYSYGGRYVFSGSTTSVTPFEWGEDSYSVVYRGSESDVYSWSDTSVLTQTNLNGADTFGAISDPVKGVDLDPTVAATTLLSDLNGGKGVRAGSIRFTYESVTDSTTFEVDLSHCVTLSDVVKAIEGNKNPYVDIQVDLTADGLSISLPRDAGGTLTVSEVGDGMVARQLGIPTGTPCTADAPLVGNDLNPVLTSTTSLDDILGSRASTTLRFAGANNDIVIQATHNGDAFTDDDGNTWPLNGVAVRIQSDTNIRPGEEYVRYDAETQELLIRIHPDNTTADMIVQAVNAAADAETIPPLKASLAGTDQQGTGTAGTGLVTLLPGVTVDGGTTSGGTGVDFDRSGIQLVNGNAVHDISFENCNTIVDVLAVLNDPRYGLLATVNDAGTGLDIRSRVSGTDFCIGENGGRTASQLGIRTTDLDTSLDEFDYGRGVVRDSDVTVPGTAATAEYSSVTPNSSLILRARDDGRQWNDYTLQFVETGDPQGHVTVAMDEDAKTITIGIKSGTTTACQIVEAFNAQPGPKQYFDLELDTRGGPNTGEGVVYDGFAKTSGGTDAGIDFTITRNDGTVLEIGLDGAKTVADVLKIINEHSDNRDGLLVATLSEYGNGIELIDRSFGDSVTRVDRSLLSERAVRLGLVDRGQEYRTATESGTRATATLATDELNSTLLITAKSVGTYADDVAVELVEGTTPGFSWDASSQTLRFTIVPGETTASDLVELFQTQATESVRAMFDIQNGVNPDGTPSDGSGRIETGTTTLTGGADAVLTGNDPNPKETESLYNALIRLQVGMEQNDENEIARAALLLDDAVARLNDARVTLGVTQNNLDNVQAQLSEEYVQHEATLNLTLRVDYTDASLNYLAQQLSYQASMQVATVSLQMSLLNYL